MSSILITGATGYLGNSLTKFFAERGYDISVLVRNPDCYSNPAELQPEKIIGFNKSMINNKPPSFDCILHCATKYKSELLFEISLANIAFPIQVANNFLKHGGTFLNIDTSLKPQTNFYATSKYHFEEILRSIALEDSIKVVNLELEYFFDENEPKTRFLSSLIRACLKNEPFKLTPGDQIRDFIYVSDLCKAVEVVFTSLSDLREQFTNIEIGLGKGVTIKELARLIKELSHSSSEFDFGAIPYRENETMVAEANTKRLYDLGWNPEFSLESALEHTIQNFKM